MKARVTIPLLAVAVLGIATPGAAQDSPADIAATFFNAIAEERWRDAARLLDLAAFDRYRRERIAAERLPQPRPHVVTAEELMRHDPDMPRAVAEYQARKAREFTPRVAAWLDYEFADVANIDSLAALPVEEAAGRWLRARDERWALERARRREQERGCILPPEAVQGLPLSSNVVIGSVTADSTTAYVLHHVSRRYRAGPDPDAALHERAPHVMTLRRRNGRWRILPRYDMLNEGQMFVSIVGPDCPPRVRPPR